MFKTILPALAFLTITSLPAFGQLGVGLKLGAPLTDALNATSPNFITGSDHWMVGPYVELNLPAGIAIEADLLYRNHSYVMNTQTGAQSGSGGSWQIPILLKKKGSFPFVKPFAEVGASFARFSDVKFSTLTNRSNYGVVMGGGIEISALLIKISPEIRYTRWGKSAFAEGYNYDQNQVAFLIGVGF